MAFCIHTRLFCTLLFDIQPNDQMNYLSMFYFFLATCTLIVNTSCVSTSSDKESRENKKVNEQEIKEVREPGILAKEIFSIPNTSFFSKTVMEIMQRGDRNLFGSHVPWSYTVLDSTFYIPQVDSSKVNIYSKEGELVKTIHIKKEFGAPHYFDISNNGDYVAGSFDTHAICQIDDKGKLVSKLDKVSNVKFCTSKNNFAFLNRSKVHDKLNLFKENIDFKYLYTTYDFFLENDSTLLISCFDENSQNVIIQKHTKIGSAIKSVSTELKFNLKDYTGIIILNSSSDSLLFLVEGSDINENTKLLSYNFKTTNYSMHEMKLDYTGDSFIGDGIAMHPTGVIYRYEKKTNSIYALLTGREAIKIFQYKLDDILTH